MRIERAVAATASVAILIASLGFVHQQIAPYLSEQSCVIYGTKGAGAAAAHISRACQSRFEDHASQEQELAQFMWSDLEGRARFLGGAMSASLYNGGGLYTITRIRVGVTDPETVDSDEPLTHYYDVRVNIPPFSSTTEEFPVYQSYDDVHWQIIKAWGRDDR
ncbi:hypothetical protein ACFQH5_20155 [Halomonas salifodinae]|uniref:Secreted protein n=1 Tax=Halomonas salifodinae TaxID=438745 RepID=A0ABW2F3X0_9GAMM